MKPNLLMRAWMMAHVYGAEYQAVVCYAGSDGDVAFREALCPQFTSTRHDAEGLRTYHITGTRGEMSISRIACGSIGGDVASSNGGPMHITITSNAHSWQEGDLSENRHLVSLDLNMQRAVRIASNFLTGCCNLKRVDFRGMHAVETLCSGFLYRCSSLEEVDLTPFLNLREVGSYFMCYTGVTSIDLTGLRAVEVLPTSFFHGCSSLQKLDLTAFVNLREVGSHFLTGCSSVTFLDLTPLRAVEVLPTNFLHGCSSLQEVDLTPLVNLREVEGNFLFRCSRVTSVRLAPHVPSSVLPEALHVLIVAGEPEVGDH